MRAKIVMAFIATISIASPTLAQTNDTLPTAKPVKPKKICRREQVTGSLLDGRSICHTKEEWADIDATNRAAVDRDLRTTPTR